MKQIKFLISIAFLSSTLLGCSVSVKYLLDDVPPVSPNPTRNIVRLAVVPFQDIRPNNERDPGSAFDFPPEKVELRDSNFKNKDVSGSMVIMIAEHLNHVRMFSQVDAVNNEFSELTPDKLAQLKNLGYQVVFTGKLSHFYGVGYATALDKAAIILTFIPITVVVTVPAMLIQKNRNEGFVELQGLQLIDIATGRSLWSGSFSSRIERYYNDAYPNAVAGEALKEIMVKVVHEIERVDFQAQKN